MGRLFLALIIGGGIFALVGYQMGLFTENGEPPPPNGKIDPKKLAALGDPLYPRQDPPKIAPGKTGKPVQDAIIFPAHVTVKTKADVSAEVPGKIMFIGEEVPVGAAQVAGVAAFVAPPYESTKIHRHDGEDVYLYRRLNENEIVEKGTMVAKIDTTKIMREVMTKDLDVSKAISAEGAAKSADREAAFRHKQAIDLYARKVIGAEELRSAELTATKFYAEYEVKKEETKSAKVAYLLALDVLKQHEVRPNLSGTRLRIQKTYKHRAETVKADEPILLLEDPDQLTAEGLLEDQFRERVREGMRVRVEPTEEPPPLRTIKGWHRGEINAVAITTQGKLAPRGDEKSELVRPLILSASEDGSVCVWDLYTENPVRELVHEDPVTRLADPVRALAVSPPGSKRNLVVTGTASGAISIWDLDDPAPKPILKTIDKAHRDAVTALAFTPDGTYFASGGADAAMFMFQAETGDKKYPFDAEHGVADPHRGTITSLHFTPHGLLISAARDNTLRMWDVRQNGAGLKQTIAGRTGSISQLGVSPDGRFMFLDRGKDLQILSAADGSRYQALQNYSTGTPFENVAIFSPDSTLMLTAGAAEGRLQLWRAPEDKSRPHEVRQFVNKDGAPVTCAAFSPHVDRGGLFALAASGHKDGSVYLWALPSAKELNDFAAWGNVTLVGGTIAGARQMRVRVDVPNPVTPRHPEGRFNTGRPVTIVIE